MALAKSGRAWRLISMATESATSFARKATVCGSTKAAKRGQQAGVVADFNADGAQDLAMVTADGQVWILWRDVSKGRNLGLSVSPFAATHGPINVTGFDGTRSLGAQPVAAGASGFFCRRSKGPIKLRWQTEPGAWQDRQVILLKPTRLQLPNFDSAQ